MLPTRASTAPTAAIGASKKPVVISAIIASVVAASLRLTVS